MVVKPAEHKCSQSEVVRRQYRRSWQVQAPALWSLVNILLGCVDLRRVEGEEHPQEYHIGYR